MKIISRVAGILLLVLGALPALAAEDNPVDAGSEVPTEPVADAEAEQEPAQPEETLPEPTGDLREVLARPVPVFIPSEAIDVDKPVDFPTNI